MCEILRVRTAREVEARERTLDHQDGNCELEEVEHKRERVAGRHEAEEQRGDGRLEAGRTQREAAEHIGRESECHNKRRHVRGHGEVELLAERVDGRRLVRRGRRRQKAAAAGRLPRGYTYCSDGLGVRSRFCALLVEDQSVCCCVRTDWCRKARSRHHFKEFVLSQTLSKIYFRM